ncbi:MAG: hypothetical protein CME34_00385 [Gordonia sp.]|nr:hypothetical protein [Gordonia sp. (in: high G+C Gram-positive bacteria)]
MPVAGDAGRDGDRVEFGERIGVLDVLATHGLERDVDQGARAAAPSTDVGGLGRGEGHAEFDGPVDHVAGGHRGSFEFHPAASGPCDEGGELSAAATFLGGADKSDLSALEACGEVCHHVARPGVQVVGDHHRACAGVRGRTSGSHHDVRARVPQAVLDRRQQS